MKIKVLYCHTCKWVYEENARGFVPTVCPECGSKNLWSTHGESAQVVRRQVRANGLTSPTWLNILCNKEGYNAPDL